MDQQPPSYRRLFFKSSHHAWLALATLGSGFVLGADRPVYLLLGAVAYTLGWIYLPDMKFFRGWVDRKNEEATKARDAEELAQFHKKREALLGQLSPHLRKRYHALADVCQEVEQASAESPMGRGGDDPRLHKLDELMWTYLRLLNLEESLEKFLEQERRENLPSEVQEAELEVAVLSRQIEDAKQLKSPSLATQERLLQSRLEALEILRKRLARVEQAQANLTLVRSEQDRLDHQIKLIRADAVALKNTSSISARIDATVDHLDQTNQWIAEMDQFTDLVGDIPMNRGRVGFQGTVPPVIPGRTTRPASQENRTG